MSINLLTIHSTDRELIRSLNLENYNAIVAGGAALRWFQDYTVEEHDIDIWFPTVESMNKFRMNIDYHPKFDTAYASTYLISNTKVQIIKKPYRTNIDESTEKNVLNLLDNFDITVCQIATDGDTWYYSDNFINDLKNKYLRMTKINENSIKRLFKYWSYGYQPDDELIKNIIANPKTIWDYTKLTEEDYGNA